MTQWFVEELANFGDHTAIKTSNGQSLSYKELASEVELLSKQLGHNKRLVVVETTNEIEPLIAYLAALKGNHAVILLAQGAMQKDSRIRDSFSPDAFYTKDDKGVWKLSLQEATNTELLHEDLSVLLSTSGTTGSAKLVKLSKSNIQSNAAAIAEYLSLTPSEKAITTLPFHYSFGMSVINSHFFAGATILLTEDSVSIDSFWEFFEQESATSFSAVPYTFELLERINFRQFNVPSLRYIAQAGGRLDANLVEQYVDWATQWSTKFFVMYGQTEAGPRIAYVPPELLSDNTDCIGTAIPGSSLALIDESGKKITEQEQVGELSFTGPGVMMGYAREVNDLSNHEHSDTLLTGDLATINENGLFKIVGRKSRFSKLFGLRISLDEIELLLSQQGLNAVVVGNDSIIVIAMIIGSNTSSVMPILTEKYQLSSSVFQILELNELPLLPSGKVDHQQLLLKGLEQTDTELKFENILAIYNHYFEGVAVLHSDDFLRLGGDSLYFVVISIAIEEYLGFLPDNWEARSIANLEAMKNQQEHITNPISAKRAWITLSIIALCLLGGEILLQTKVYLQTGRSALSLLTGESTTVFNQALNVKTYRPNLTTPASSNTISLTINSSGLRSPEIPLLPEKDELRIAVLGASTVAGAYATLNSKTFPALIEKKLRRQNNKKTINVINAGIEGHTLHHTHQLTKNLISQFKPSIAVLYPGFNDITLLCKAMNQHSSNESRGLPFPSLPPWLLTEEMLRKNTTFLRANPLSSSKMLDLSTFNTNEYTNNINRIINTLQQNNIQPVLTTVARSYLNVPLAEQAVLAQGSLYYYYCLDFERLLYVTQAFNNAIRALAIEKGIPLIDIAKQIPGGKEFFVDGGHFTFTGEKYAADIFSENLQRLIKQQEVK